MMKKTGAGLLCAGFVLLAGSVWADEAAPVGESPVATQAEGKTNEVAISSAKGIALARLEEVKALPLVELKEKLAQTDAALPVMNQKLGEVSRSAQAARETAADNSQEIKDLYLQIRALHDRIAALTETLPEVQQTVAEQTTIRSDLLQEMEFRTKLMGLINQRELAEASKANVEKLP